MTQMDILEELKKLTNAERLAIIEAVLRMIREDFQQMEQPLTQVKRQLALAAKALLPDYAEGSELTTSPLRRTAKSVNWCCGRRNLRGA